MVSYPIFAATTQFGPPEQLIIILLSHNNIELMTTTTSLSYPVMDHNNLTIQQPHCRHYI